MSSLMWFFGGLLAGYTLGRIRRDVARVRDAVTNDELEPTTQAARPVRWWRALRSHRDLVLGVLLLMLAVGSVFSTVLANERLASVAECQSRANEQLRDAIADRANAQRQESDGQRRLLEATLGRAGTEQAIRDYLAALDELDIARRANPLPEQVDCR